MDYTERTVKLPDGIEILYTDSGAPDSLSYTTLLLLHGSAFSGDGMVGLHQYARKNNMRVVLWNRRGYRGSTGYTDSEIEDLKAGRQVFQDRFALQLAWFFQYFIDQENIPKVSADRKVGGFILGGWSFGNTVVLSLFSDPRVLPRDLYEDIEPYVLSLVLYDPPYTALGYAPMPEQVEVYNPWTDPDYPTPEAQMENFQFWVSAYHEHPDLASGRMSYTKRPVRSTLTSWTEEQKARCIDAEAALRCDIPAFAPATQTMFKNQAFHVLFDAKIVSSYFPDVNVFHMGGAASSYFCVWSYLVTCRMYEEAIGRGERVRPITFKMVEGANHFMHYDLPELFLRTILEGCTK